MIPFITPRGLQYSIVNGAQIWKRRMSIGTFTVRDRAQVRASARVRARVVDRVYLAQRVRERSIER